MLRIILHPKYQIQIMFQKSVCITSYKAPELGIFLNGIQSVLPAPMAKKILNVSDGKLFITERSFILNKNVYIVAFGKAAMGMAREVFDVLEDHIQSGIISIPKPSDEDKKLFPKLFTLSPTAASKINVFEGPRDNQPDNTVIAASQAISKLVSSLSNEDILLTCITGGGSALLCLPRNPSISIGDMVQTARSMVSAGASIDQLNVIRRFLDQMKGGGLAKMAAPSQVISLILSDVVGDPLSTIASGPTVPVETSANECLHVLDKLDVKDKIPPNVLAYILEQSKISPSPDVSLNSLEKPPFNVIIGNNRRALDACSKSAEELGLLPLVLTDRLEGDSEERAKQISELILVISQYYQNTEDKTANSDHIKTLMKSLDISGDCVGQLFTILQSNRDPYKLCLLLGGETTVKLHRKDSLHSSSSHSKSFQLGGRCSHMALTAALYMKDHFPESLRDKVTVLYGATDGLDGPTDGAGAWIRPECVDEACKAGIMTQTEVTEYWLRFNSYSFFAKLNQYGSTGGFCYGGLLKTGLTGTNVMDLIIVTITL